MGREKAKCEESWCEALNSTGGETERTGRDVGRERSFRTTTSSHHSRDHRAGIRGALTECLRHLFGTITAHCFRISVIEGESEAQSATVRVSNGEKARLKMKLGEVLLSCP